MQDFQNWHKSINVGGSVQRELIPYNGATIPTETHSIQSNEFKQGLQQLLQYVADAMKEEEPVRIRSYGSKWSLNNAAYTNSYMVKSWGLNYCKIGLDTTEVTANYQANADKLCFVQTGVMIHDLNNELFARRLVLKTTGASDGQRLVGAISAGTHGSAMNFGSMQDYVKGIHLVIPKGTDSEHVFVQRASDPVINDNFAAFLDNTRIIQDDDLFNAAVVGFGSFGLIHGLLIETEAMFQLKYKIVRFNPDDPHYKEPLRQALANPTRANIRAITTKRGEPIFDWVNDETGYPYFFSVTRNPYDNKLLNPRTFFVEVMEKVPLSAEFDAYSQEELASYLQDQMQNGNIQVHEKHEAVYHGLQAHLAKNLSDPTKSNSLHKEALSAGIQIGLMVFHRHESKIPEIAVQQPPTTNFPNLIFHTKSATSPITNAPMPASSTEIGVPLSHVTEAVDAILETLQDPNHLLATPLGIRYIPNSLATLAVNQSFDPSSEITVTIELPGPDGNGHFIPPAAPAHQAIFEMLKARGIPHRFHWGQQYPLNSDWVSQSYAPEKVAAWKTAREQLLPTAKAQFLFSNDMTDAIGLTDSSSNVS